MAVKDVDVVVDEETVLDPNSEAVPVLQGEALKESDTVPDALNVVRVDGDVETVTLADPLFELVADALAEAENDDEIVDDTESEPDGV